MQTTVPELRDVSKEPPEVHEMYGIQPRNPSFGNNCLLARRRVDPGVRFVQLYHRDWGRETYRPAAGLVRDLKQRELLDATLVAWGGELVRNVESATAKVAAAQAVVQRMKVVAALR